MGLIKTTLKIVVWGGIIYYVCPELVTAVWDLVKSGLGDVAQGLLDKAQDGTQEYVKDKIHEAIEEEKQEQINRLKEATDWERHMNEGELKE